MRSLFQPIATIFICLCYFDANSQVIREQSNPNVNAQTKTQNNCEVELTTERLRDSVLKYPITGKTLVESHLITDEDGIRRGSLIHRGSNPTNDSAGIQKHIEDSCAYLVENYNIKNEECQLIYSKRYSKVWSGTDGYGEFLGVPNRYFLEGKKFHLSRPDEIFMINIDHVNPTNTTTNLPPQGTRYLICKAEKCVVVAGGIESGPRIHDARMGFTPEVAYFLGASNPDTATIQGRMKDQSIPLGPITCDY